MYDPTETSKEPSEAVKKPKRAKKTAIRADLLKVMHRNPGLHMTVNEVLDELHAMGRTDLDQTQVNTALHHSAALDLVIRVATGVYLYDPRRNNTPTESDSRQNGAAQAGGVSGVGVHIGHLYETVGQIGLGLDGREVVRSDDGQLFVVVPIELALKPANGS